MNMKPTDLRIGDSVLYQGHVCIVEEISAKGWVHLLYADTRTRVNLTSDYVIDELQPIPISPEEEQLRHWQDLRERVAIAVLPQCIKTVQDVLLRGGSLIEDTVAKQAAVNAVEYADALVKKLKGE